MLYLFGYDFWPPRAIYKCELNALIIFNSKSEVTPENTYIKLFGFPAIFLFYGLLKLADVQESKVGGKVFHRFLEAASSSV